MVKQKNMNRTNKRNFWGSIFCYLLSVLLGGIGIAIFMLREVWQAVEWNADIERDDIVRYSVVGTLGYITQIVILLWIFL